MFHDYAGEAPDTLESSLIGLRSDRTITLSVAVIEDGGRANPHTLTAYDARRLYNWLGRTLADIDAAVTA
jgi:hypothetical protein